MLFTSFGYITILLSFKLYLVFFLALQLDTPYGKSHYFFHRQIEELEWDIFPDRHQ